MFDPTKFDANGPIDIPSRETFYAVLFPKQLYILGSRRDQLRQTVKVLDLSTVSPSYTDQYCFNYNIKINRNGEDQGGIVPVNLDEGSCLKLTVAAVGSKEIWLICFNSVKMQQVWLKKLKDVPYQYNLYIELGHESDCAVQKHRGLKGVCEGRVREFERSEVRAKWVPARGP